MNRSSIILHIRLCNVFLISNVKICSRGRRQRRLPRRSLKYMAFYASQHGVVVPRVLVCGSRDSTRSAREMRAFHPRVGVFFRHGGRARMANPLVTRPPFLKNVVAFLWLLPKAMFTWSRWNVVPFSVSGYLLGPVAYAHMLKDIQLENLAAINSSVGFFVFFLSTCHASTIFTPVVKPSRFFIHC